MKSESQNSIHSIEAFFLFLCFRLGVICFRLEFRWSFLRFLFLLLITLLFKISFFLFLCLRLGVICFLLEFQWSFLILFIIVFFFLRDLFEWGSSWLDSQTSINDGILILTLKWFIWDVVPKAPTIWGRIYFMWNNNTKITPFWILNLFLWFFEIWSHFSNRWVLYLFLLVGIGTGTGYIIADLFE